MICITNRYYLDIDALLEFDVAFHQSTVTLNAPFLWVQAKRKPSNKYNLSKKETEF